MTLSDQFASTLTVDALVRSRDGVVDPALPAAGNIRMPALKPPTVLRWDPWVRIFLGVQGLMEGLRFVPSHLSEGDGGAAVAAELEGRAVALYASADDSLPVVQMRRPKPDVFAAQLRQVLDWAELRAERASEILAQIDNQHAFWGSVVPYHTGRMRRTAELLEAVIQFVVFVEARFKHELGCWRANELSTQVQPLITTPGHGSLPSGHCTQAYAVAHVLARLVGVKEPGTGGDREVQLQRLAARISMNRVVAGVHFPVDNLAGRLLGRCLGEYALSRMVTGDPAWLPRSFDGHAVPAAEEFRPQTQAQTLDSLAPQDPERPQYYTAWGELEAAAPPAAPLLREMWDLAAAECAYLV